MPVNFNQVIKQSLTSPQHFFIINNSPSRLDYASMYYVVHYLNALVLYSTASTCTVCSSMPSIKSSPPSPLNVKYSFCVSPHTVTYTHTHLFLDLALDLAALDFVFSFLEDAFNFELSDRSHLLLFLHLLWLRTELAATATTARTARCWPPSSTAAARAGGECTSAWRACHRSETSKAFCNNSVTN